MTRIRWQFFLSVSRGNPSCSKIISSAIAITISSRQARWLTTRRKSSLFSSKLRTVCLDSRVTLYMHVNTKASFTGTVAISVNAIKPSAYVRRLRQSTLWYKYVQEGRGTYSRWTERRRDEGVRPWARPKLSMESFALWPFVYTGAKVLQPRGAPLQRNRATRYVILLSIKSEK